MLNAYNQMHGIFQATTKTNMQPHICGKESGSRFGTAIASADLDDDDIPG